ncbi:MULTISPECIES: hypothetical protein [Campylobacter]|uniref:hypothetical protein n=1 Tax=Campylobacter TaxID=194 RepID=UPI001470151F|nr:MULTISPECIES: hypothetical protein [Campylobacter]MBN7287450.1 hypothetical protein [Campylobacter curvus]MDU6828097.1 hypothetical protein [Campylobacter sp.]
MKFLLLMCLTLLLFSGCASQVVEPHIIYKDVLVPVRCDADMPVRPLNKGNFESHKALMIYYLKCEDLLKQCIGENK